MSSNNIRGVRIFSKFFNICNQKVALKEVFRFGYFINGMQPRLVSISE